MCTFINQMLLQRFLSLMVFAVSDWLTDWLKKSEFVIFVLTMIVICKSQTISNRKVSLLYQECLTSIISTKKIPFWCIWFHVVLFSSIYRTHHVHSHNNQCGNGTNPTSVAWHEENPVALPKTKVFSFVTHIEERAWTKTLEESVKSAMISTKPFSFDFVN